MAERTTDFDRWYLWLLAMFFAFACGACSVRYVWMDFADAGYVPMSTQILCFALTVASIAYFIRPKLGHHVLLALTVAVLLFASPAGPAEAVVFWLFVGGLLVLPWLSRQSKLSPLASRSSPTC